MRNGPFTDSVTIRAAISPAGDEDVFQFTNQSASIVTMKFETWGKAFGINVPCGTDNDTRLYILDATRTVLGNNDDRNPFDYCSTVSIRVGVGEAVYAHLLGFQDNIEIHGYILVATYLP